MQECQQHKQTVAVLQREVDSLRGDNVKLYEKIKFLQSYPGTVSKEVCSVKWSFVISVQRKTVDDREALGRYSSQYEANLDPFAAFGAKVGEACLQMKLRV